MQAEHLSDELLQRHYDGDLERSEAARAGVHLHGCPKCMAKHVGLAKLSELIAHDARRSTREVSFEGMFARIEQGIAQDAAANGAAESSGAKVVSITSRKRVFGATSALIAGFAAAAAVILMVYRPGGGSHTLPDGQVPAAGSTPTETSAAPAPAAPTQASENPPSHSEVVQVDFGNNAGTVFDIALADGSSTPVIWINDDE